MREVREARESKCRVIRASSRTYVAFDNGGAPHNTLRFRLRTSDKSGELVSCLNGTKIGLYAPPAPVCAPWHPYTGVG